ncbi:MAG: hypothetical protein ABIR96_05990 [Bdellovibrionota bacterium]
MKFHIFLSNLGQHKNCTNLKDLFEDLGGERVLGIGLRTFRAVGAGQIPPSLRFFSNLFSLLPNHLKKEAVVSFFENSSSNGIRGADICEYLKEKIIFDAEDPERSFWVHKEPQLFSEKQLVYLSRSDDIVRIYNRLVAHGEVSISEIKSPVEKEILDSLVELDIAVIEGRKYLCSRNLYKLPHQNNSPTHLIGPSTDFILRHLSAFVVREGRRGEQEIGFCFSTCKKSDALKIFLEMNKFKNWVQSLMLREDHVDEVGFVWMDFSRMLTKGRDY